MMAFILVKNQGVKEIEGAWSPLHPLVFVEFSTGKAFPKPWVYLDWEQAKHAYRQLIQRRVK